MKIKKHYLVFALVFLFLLVGTTISYGSFNATNSTVESGDKITVQVTSSEALDAYNVDLESCEGLTFNSCSKTDVGALININGSSIGYMNPSGKTTDLGTYSFTAPSVTEDKEYTITFKIDRKTTVTSKITVKAPDVKPPTETPTTSTTPPATTVTKSSEARLKMIKITPKQYDFTGFNKDIKVYPKDGSRIKVPYSVTKINIEATKLQDGQKVTGTGEVALKEGNNDVVITVTAENGSVEKYTIKYVRQTEAETAAEEAEKQGEARLSSLGIKPEKYDFEGFNKDKTEYSVQIPENINEIEVYATALNPNAQITGTGIITLEEGESTLEIVVISENGTKKTYSINVIRTEAETTEEPEQPIEEKFGLSKLSIAGVTLNPKFDVETYEYKIDIKEVITSLQIIAEANDKDATVEIVGNENFQDGENVITILVKNDKTEEIATYQIIANVSVEVEQVPMSWLKPSTWGKEEIIKIILIVVLIILIISAIILKINISKENKKAKKVDLPGADELDKAIAEHQELAEEEVNSEENVEKDEAKANYLEEIAKSRLSEDNNSDFAVEEDDIKPRKRGKHF